MNAVSYSEFRRRLASIMDELVENRETVVITRRGHPDVAMLPADELSSLLETVHLLRSPRNAKRLLGALARSYTGEGQQEMTFDEIVQAAKGPSSTRKPGVSADSGR
ncbi:MAG: type II toxin-antitoxin system Phd/YefM family antitoxin [Verrucomicrobia bacterium]|nr:type II toxin-antitoxin system Phd/YefM family antitoxin [Verrucomicrobiota bacterium]